MHKEKLRAQLRQSRLNMPSAGVAAKSQKITAWVLQVIDWSAVRSLHIYSSVEQWHEVDTSDLVRQISSRWSNIKIVQPQLMRDNPIPKEPFDVIIVPTLGFDKTGNRLGLGGGWYDRFLITQPEALKVGLAYQDSFIAAGLPTELHDVKLDKIITEQGII